MYQSTPAKSRKSFNFNNNMAANGLQLMPVFKPKSDSTNTSARWTQWLERFNTYVIAANIKDSARKRALLMYTSAAHVSSGARST